jgi:tetratricopeptide (TPR) repeat protein
MQRAGIVLAFLVASTLTPAALAQKVPAACPERPADEGAAKKAAKQWFVAGESMFAVGRYAEALESFRCSAQIFPHRVTIYNASQAALFAGNKRVALELTEQYLAIAPDGEKAREARKTLVELKVAVGIEESVAEEEAKRKLAEESAARPEPEPAPQPAEPQPAEDGGRPLGLAPLIVAAVLTAGLGATTVALDFKVGERFDKADETGDSADRDSAESLQVAERVFFGLTLAGAVTTGVLLFLTDFEKRESEEEAATVAMTPLVLERGAGLALLRRF